MATIGIVVGIHAAMGAGVVFLQKTEAGREIMHKINFYQPPEVEEPETQEPEVEPPPVVEAPIEAPPVVDMAAPAAASAASSVSIGSNAGGMNWSGGKFVDRLGEGPLGAFHGCVIGRYRSCLGGWNELAKQVEFEVRLGANGKVVSSRMTRSSGSSDQDRVLNEALQCVQREFRCPLPADDSAAGRVITVKLAPSVGGIRVTP
jgi:hypothetical protein